MAGCFAARYRKYVPQRAVESDVEERHVTLVSQLSGKRATRRGVLAVTSLGRGAR
jgi:hypothetical protein